MNDVRLPDDDQVERLARYRAGSMSKSEREAFEKDVLASETLSEALYAELSLEVAANPEAPEQPESRRGASIRPLRPRAVALRWLPIAAGLAAVVALGWWRWHPRPLPQGADYVRGEAGLTALEPSGTLDAPPARFRWTRDPGAASYRVELFDASGNDVATAVTRDTVLAFTAVTGETLSAGQWRVVAIGADGLDRRAVSRAAYEVRPR